MNKIIPFNKDITFNDKIGEITSIALDDVLKFENDYLIKGELIIRGCHKYDEIEEDFSYPLPVEITVDNKYDTKKASIGIDDFYYEIINENILHVKIDLILDDLYYKEEKKEDRIDLDLNLDKTKLDVSVDTNDLEKVSENKEDSTNNLENHDVIDLFSDNKSDEKEYSIYRVYTMTGDDTLESILNKYKVSKDDLEEYNDLSNLQMGDKIIIPTEDE